MKKLFRLINIAFLLVLGATFAPQINSGIDWISEVDYTAVGNQIGAVATVIADAAVAVYNWVVGLFAEAA